MNSNMKYEITGIILVIIIDLIAFIIIQNIVDFEVNLKPLEENIGLNNMECVDEKDKVQTVTSVKAISEMSSNNPLGSMITIKNNPAFLMNYEVSEDKESSNLFFSNYSLRRTRVGDEVSFKTNASDQLMSILLSGYPYAKAVDVGLETEEQMYQATQIAIFEIAMRTGESNNDLYESAYLKTLKKQWGKNLDTKVFDVASALIKPAEDEGYKKFPDFKVVGDNVETKEIYEDENGTKYIIRGPYRAEWVDESAELYNYNFNVKITDPDGRVVNSTIVDKDKKIIKPDIGEEYYTKIEYKPGDWIISSSLEGYRIVGNIMRNGKQEYIYLTTIKDTINLDWLTSIK